MKKIFSSLSRIAPAACGAVALFAAGCSGEPSEPTIRSAGLFLDAEGERPAEVFGQGNTFHAIVTLADAPKTTVTKARWIAVDVEADVPEEHLVREVEVEHGSGTLTFDLANDDLWPAGSYRVDILLNGEAKESLPFTVE